MNILAFRMEAYRLAYEIISLGFGCTLAGSEDVAPTREIVDRSKVDMFLIGYLRNGTCDSFEILERFHCDPVLSKIPAALIIGEGDGAVSQLNFQRAKASFGNALIPIFYPGDLVPQYLSKTLGEHAGKCAVPRLVPRLVTPFPNDVIVKKYSVLVGETDGDESRVA